MRCSTPFHDGAPGSPAAGPCDWAVVLPHGLAVPACRACAEAMTSRSSTFRWDDVPLAGLRCRPLEEGEESSFLRAVACWEVLRS